jgi:hypothetical protein
VESHQGLGSDHGGDVGMARRKTAAAKVLMDCPIVFT